MAPSSCLLGFNVGKRKNGKMLRVYEKGMQLGGQWHPWVRWEVELHNKDRIIPWDVLLEPRRFFVGFYPNTLGWAQVEMSKIRTLQKQSKISYEHLTAYAAVAYGPLPNVMLEVEGSADAVLKKLHRLGSTRRLIHPFIDKPSEFIERSMTEAAREHVLEQPGHYRTHRAQNEIEADRSTSAHGLALLGQCYWKTRSDVDST
jgi:hypothetical protein